MRVRAVLAGLVVALGGFAPIPAATATGEPATPTAIPTGDGYTALTPMRVLDTRTNGGRVAKGSVTAVTIAGANGVPTTAHAAAVTVTVTDPADDGFVTVFPCGKPVPLASNVNVRWGQTVPNLVTSSLGDTGRLCVFASMAANLVMDVSGYYDANGVGFATVSPARIVDTRQAAGKTAAGSVVRVSVAGTAGVPATGATAVLLNLTVTQPDKAGFVTAFPCGQPAPLASSVNFVGGQDAADAAVVGLGPDGDVCVLASARTHLVVDVIGWFGSAATGRFVATDPRRLLDTRTAGRPVPAGGSITVNTALPGGTALLNVTVTDPQQPGFVTVYPCDEAVPNASTVNFAPGQVVANAVAAGVDASGAVCLYASAATHVVVDLNGTSTAGRTAVSAVPAAQVALAWGKTQMGAPYAAINPYRFGDSTYGKPWDCPAGQAVCTRVDIHGGARTVAAGTFVYDCSGLVVAAWLRAGVDLVKKNAAWTDTMYQNLPHVSRDQALPGDLVLFGATSDPTNGVSTSHVGLYLDDGHILESGGGCSNDLSVCIGPIDWSRVVAVARAW